MSRTWIMVSLATGIALTGCQKAKMKSVQPESTPSASASAEPPPYSPPQGIPNQPVYIPPGPGQYQPPVIVQQQPPQVTEEVQPNHQVPIYNPPNDNQQVREWYEVTPVQRGGELILPIGDEEPPIRSNQIPEPLPQENCHENGLCDPPEPEPGQCHDIELNAEKEMRELDILFVVDTSASLRGGSNKGNGGELAQLARDMDKFVARLNPDTDYQIGVLLGHGPHSPYHGQLFSAGRGDSAVIHFQDIYKQEARRGGSKEEIRGRVSSIIAQMLEAKMKAIPAETDKLVRGKPSAQGEALLLTLYNSLGRAEYLQAMKGQGFLRDEAGLAIIMMSDEQDVCFNYEGSGFTPRMKQIRTKSGVQEVPDKHELRFFNEVCTTAANGSLLTPEHVAEVVQNLKGDKVVTSSVAYLDNNIPVGVEDENERGSGIIEFVGLTKGQNVDLAKVDRSANTSFADQMSFLGEFTYFKLRYNNTFGCRTNVHPVAVNPTSVELTIVNEQQQPVARFSGRCAQGESCDQANGPVITEIRRHGRGGNPFLVLTVPFERINEVLKQAGFEKGRVQIHFMAKSDVDPQTGGPRDNRRR